MVGEGGEGARGAVGGGAASPPPADAPNHPLLPSRAHRHRVTTGREVARGKIKGRRRCARAAPGGPPAAAASPRAPQAPTNNKASAAREARRPCKQYALRARHALTLSPPACRPAAPLRPPPSRRPAPSAAPRPRRPPPSARGARRRPRPQPPRRATPTAASAFPTRPTFGRASRPSKSSAPAPLAASTSTPGAASPACGTRRRQGSRASGLPSSPARGLRAWTPPRTPRAATTRPATSMASWRAK
jgi:hypothetical protein